MIYVLCIVRVLKSFWFSGLNIFVQMSRNKFLSAKKRVAITKQTSEDTSPSYIAKELNRDARTVKKAI